MGSQERQGDHLESDAGGWIDKCQTGRQFSETSGQTEGSPVVKIAPQRCLLSCRRWFCISTFLEHRMDPESQYLSPLVNYAPCSGTSEWCLSVVAPCTNSLNLTKDKNQKSYTIYLSQTVNT